jgi:hypothetical protein
MRDCYTIGVGSRSRDPGPDLSPHPPTPHEVGAAIISQSIVGRGGRRIIRDHEIGSRGVDTQRIYFDKPAPVLRHELSAELWELET